MTLFFTSDQHYFHKNIIRYCDRPFGSATHMNEEMIRRFNEVVGDDDVVYHLGDFSLDKGKVYNILSQLKGTHHLISGNHDRCHSYRNDHELWIGKYKRFGFSTINERLIINVPELGDVLLTHMPRSDDPNIRFHKFRPNDWNDWIFCGHIHEKWLKVDNQINVGVDQHDFYPVTLKRLVEIALT